MSLQQLSTIVAASCRDRDGDRPPREPRGPSAADEVDDWGAKKSFVPSEAPARGFGGGGGFGGFRERDGERPAPEPREPRPLGAADLVDDWGAKKAFVPSEPTPDRAPRERRGFGGGESKPGLDADRWERKAEAAPAAAAPAPDAAPAERKKLALAPRSKPLEQPGAYCSNVGCNAQSLLVGNLSC